MVKLKGEHIRLKKLSGFSVHKLYILKVFKVLKVILKVTQRSSAFCASVTVYSLVMCTHTFKIHSLKYILRHIISLVQAM